MVNNEDMKSLHTAVGKLFSAHAGRRKVLTGSRYLDFDDARAKLLAAWGVTLDEYHNWCEAMDDAEPAS